MKIKPILFITPTVQAILEGNQTQTRRIVKPQPDGRGLRFTNKFETYHGQKVNDKYQKDDILWVRETFCPVVYAYTFEDKGFKYRADNNTEHCNGCWKPSIFMPKEAARIFLKVTNVRVERLHDISESDAIAEGVIYYGEESNDYKNYLYNDKYGDDWGLLTAKESFESLWRLINGNWDDNPFVWVYEFERTEKPKNFIQ